MKPPPFDYYDPQTLEEALQLLASTGSDSKLLAGGQSLVPSLNFRLARPSALIDLNPVAELDYIRERDGAIAIGAMTRQQQLQRSSLVQNRYPLLAEASALIGHPPIRARGTVGGSLAHADPAAELPAAVCLLNGTLLLARATTQRTVPAADFFLGYLTTCLEPDEALIELRLPPPPARTGYGFVEFARRKGDFALVGVAASVTRSGDGERCTGATIVLIGVGSGPVRATTAEASLNGALLRDQSFAEAAREAGEEIDPLSDVHASAEARRQLAKVAVCRALAAAASSAGEASI